MVSASTSVGVVFWLSEFFAWRLNLTLFIHLVSLVSPPRVMTLSISVGPEISTDYVIRFRMNVLSHARSSKTLTGISWLSPHIIVAVTVCNNVWLLALLLLLIKPLCVVSEFCGCAGFDSLIGSEYNNLWSFFPQPSAVQVGCLHFLELWKLFVGFRQLKQSFLSFAIFHQSSDDLSFAFAQWDVSWSLMLQNAHSELWVCFTHATRADTDETTGRFLLPGLSLLLSPFLL